MKDKFDFNIQDLDFNELMSKTRNLYSTLQENKFSYNDPIKDVLFAQRFIAPELFLIKHFWFQLSNKYWILKNKDGIIFEYKVRNSIESLKELKNEKDINPETQILIGWEEKNWKYKFKGWIYVKDKYEIINNQKANTIRTTIENVFWYLTNLYGIEKWKEKMLKTYWIKVNF